MDKNTKANDIKSDSNTRPEGRQISKNESNKDRQERCDDLEEKNCEKDATPSARDTFEQTKTDDDDLWNDCEGWGVNEENEWEIAKCTTEKSIKKVDNQLDITESHDKCEKNNSKLVSDKNNVEVTNKDHNDNSGSSDTWTGWGKWGVTSILSSASQGVSMFTNSVSQGVSTVLESSIGIPDPEKLAELNHAETKIEHSDENQTELKESKNENSSRFNFSNIGSIVSEVSKLVESTGTKVISGGLDTLEIIGKKTMEVLQEGDPGLKKKRAFLTIEQEKPVLSRILREAKEKAEEENKLLLEKHLVQYANYETLLDNYQALVHLEALEMLSKQCDIKLQTLTSSSMGESLTEIQETMEQVKELCELSDQEEDELTSTEEVRERLKAAIDELDVYSTYDKVITILDENECSLTDLDVTSCDETKLCQHAIETLAQLTAVAIEQFHKSGELLLLKSHRSTADEADSLVRLTTAMTSLIGIVATKFSEKLNAKSTNSSNKEYINDFITNIFFEASNSCSYIQNAFNLLVPVLQVGAI